MTLKEFFEFSRSSTNEYFAKRDLSAVKPEEIRDGVTAYFLRGGKRFRPALVFMCAGAAGGEEGIQKAVSVACAAELYHIFTLVHDDIIDNDDTRRGGPTVHIKVKNDLISSKVSEEDASRYGMASAILSGDVLFGLAVDSVCDAVTFGADISAVQRVVRMLTMGCSPALVEGEALDTRYGMTLKDAEKLFEVSDREVLNVLAKKTGELFSFCTRSGYIIGSSKGAPSEDILNHLNTFSIDCGIAFQLRDDILGILSDEATLGKPIGSDIREAKNTFVLRESYRNSSDKEKSFLRATVGSKDATSSDIKEAIDIIKKNGGIEYSAKLAEEYTSCALSALNILESSQYKELLKETAHAMSVRIS